MLSELMRFFSICLEISTMLRKTLESFLLILLTFSSLAHDDLHDRIQVITADIHKFPQDIDLYYQRGILYLEHENYRVAIRDLRYCEKKGQVTTRTYYA